MGYIDYSKENQSDIAFIDMKSFYASAECVLGPNPLHTSLCVMSRSDNSEGLILASSPTFKQVFGKAKEGRSYDLPFDIRTRKLNCYNAWNKGIFLVFISLMIKMLHLLQNSLLLLSSLRFLLFCGQWLAHGR